MPAVMEHRCGSRHPVRAAIVLRTPGWPPVLGHTREVSISGMFVDAPPEHFCTNTVIELEATVPGTAGLRTYRWQAMVVRRTDSGLGLMFDRLRPPAVSRLIAGAEAGYYPPPPAANAPRPADSGLASRH